MKTRFTFKEINTILDSVKNGKTNEFKLITRGMSDLFYFESNSFIIRSNEYISFIFRGKMVLQILRSEEKQSIVLPSELAKKFQSPNKIEIFWAPQKTNRRIV